MCRGPGPGSSMPIPQYIPGYGINHEEPLNMVSDRGLPCHASSSPEPLKTRRGGQRCTLNLSRAETSSAGGGVVVRRGVPAQKCRPRHSDHGSKLRVRRQSPRVA
ncbi:hypothetical protein TNCV_1987091 [Trichonephila clavipes]|nr:hypothetical protein TNCV_1987091 [Trichonephila clavipes]